MQAEKDALLSEKNAGAESSAEEMEKLLSTVTSLTAERDQLRMDLQENVEMVSRIHSCQLCWASTVCFVSACHSPTENTFSFLPNR